MSLAATPTVEHVHREPSAARPTVAHVMRAYLAPTETFVLNQISSLRRHRPVVVAHHRRPETEASLCEGAIALEQLPGAVRRLDALAYRTARVALPTGNAALAAYVRDQDARLLHFHFLTDARFMAGVHRRTGLPAVVSGYGYDVSWFPLQWHGLGRRYLLPVFDRVDCVLAMSDDMRRDICALGCPEHKVLVHYYGADTARFRHPERVYETDGPPAILLMGRLEAKKGHEFLLQALRRVDRRGVDFRVVFVGDGTLRVDLERIVAADGWQDRVVFTGHVPYGSAAHLAYLRTAHVFAHPSVTVDGHKEGIPGTIVEAMACGLPVVATHHAGIPAVVTHGREGLLVDEHDVDALADALEALIDDAALRQRLGRAAARRATESLDLHARTAALERVYDRWT
jgi:colanic acid/amylovoran biosynthesis glycosyltransferase